jgi:hypothetical protein
VEQRQGRLKNSRLDLLLYHYVGLRKREDLKVSHVSEEFKDWWELNAANTDAELKRLCALAKHFEVFVAPDQKSRFGLFCRHASVAQPLKIMKTRACVIEILSCILETRAPSLKSVSP